MEERAWGRGTRVRLEKFCPTRETEENPAGGPGLAPKPQYDRHRPFMTISSRCLRNPGIGVYLEDNPEVSLTALGTSIDSSLPVVGT